MENNVALEWRIPIAPLGWCCCFHREEHHHTDKNRRMSNSDKLDMAARIITKRRNSPPGVVKVV